MRRGPTSNNAASEKGSTVTSAGGWQPTTFLRFEEPFDSSMGTARIVTDAGAAYIKAMGSRQGPHQLACELVGTQLARWLGLPTFDFAIMSIDAEVDEIPFFRGGKAASGPAFVTRAVSGHTWGGSEQELDAVVNPEAISWLVVFDTWTLNCDRHPPDLTVRRPKLDNVFLERVGDKEKAEFRLVAMDQTHCFTCGGELTPKIASIDRVKDLRLYGMFPAFAARVRDETVAKAIERLGQLNEDAVDEMIQSVPELWEVNQKVRAAWKELICRRAEFVAESVMNQIAKVCWPSQLFDKKR